MCKLLVKQATSQLQWMLMNLKLDIHLESTDSQFSELYQVLHSFVYLQISCKILYINQHRILLHM
jgi:hypothetical protein